MWTSPAIQLQSSWFCPSFGPSNSSSDGPSSCALFKVPLSSQLQAPVHAHLSKACILHSNPHEGNGGRQVQVKASSDKIRVVPGGRRPRRKGAEGEPAAKEPSRPKKRSKEPTAESSEEEVSERIRLLERLADEAERPATKSWREEPESNGLAEQIEWLDHNMTTYKQEDFSDGYPSWAQTLENFTNVDPELKDILGSSIGDPKEMQERMQRRLQQKKDDLFADKTGSSTPMQVVFKNFNPFDFHLWFELHDRPEEEDADLLAGVVRAWFMVGKLGGYNAMNTQVMDSQSLMRLESTDKNVMGSLQYDQQQTTSKLKSLFHDIGDFELQHKWGRIWCNIGTADALAIDVLINALETFSDENLGIKQVIFGGKVDHWDGMMDEEDEGYLKIRI